MGFQELLEVFIKLSPFVALLLVLYWNERKERIKAQETLVKFLSEQNKTMAEFAEEHRTCINNNTQKMGIIEKQQDEANRRLEAISKEIIQNNARDSGRFRVDA